MAKIITITTDFGDDFALAQLKGVILRGDSLARIITISNQVTKYSILEGAFILSNSCYLFPKGSIHIGIVDPGVGSNREGIIIVTTDGHTFIGPNNGLFTEAVKNNVKKVFKINEELVNKEHSNTFHGRDIFAKIAGLMSRGLQLSSLCDPISETSLLRLKVKFNQVLHIDPYGNIKINNNCHNFRIGDQINIEVNKRSLLLPFVSTFADVKTGELLAYKGSHGILEIAKNLGSANDELNLQIGDILLIWKV